MSDVPNEKTEVAPISKWWRRNTEVVALKKELADQQKELLKLTRQQEMRDLVAECIDKAFERNRQRTRLTCWYCDRAIDEGQGYDTWLGCRLHSDCTEEFRKKVAPVLQAHRESHSNFLIDGLPIFKIEPPSLTKKGEGRTYEQTN